MKIKKIKFLLPVLGAVLFTALGLPVRAVDATATLSIPVTQEINSEKDKEDADKVSVSYELMAMDPANPMPEGTENNVFDFTMTGNDAYEINGLTYSHAGVYEYTLVRTGEDINNIEPVIDTYQLQVYVNNTDSGLSASLLAVLPDGDKDDEVCFSYDYVRELLHVKYPDLVAYSGSYKDGMSFPSPRMEIEEFAENDAVRNGLTLHFEDGSEYTPDIINEMKDYFLIDSSLCVFVDANGNVHETNNVLDDYMELTFSLKDDVYATDSEGTKYDLIETPGKLEIKEVSSVSSTESAILSPVIHSEDELKVTKDAQAVVSENSVFLVNNIANSVLAGNEVSLLYDDILLPEDTGEGYSRISLMIERVKEVLSDAGYSDDQINSPDRLYIGKYLDLVDAADGNIWVTSTEGAEIYLPYPEGTDQNTEFDLIHLTDLHRGYFYDDDTLHSLISSSNVENVEIENTAYGIKFHSEQNGFSPFILTWIDKTGETVDDSVSNEEIDNNKPATGNYDITSYWWILLIVSAAGVAYFVKAREN